MPSTHFSHAATRFEVARLSLLFRRVSDWCHSHCRPGWRGIRRKAAPSIESHATPTSTPTRRKAPPNGHTPAPALSSNPSPRTILPLPASANPTPAISVTRAGGVCSGCAHTTDGASTEHQTETEEPLGHGTLLVALPGQLCKPHAPDTTKETGVSREWPHHRLEPEAACADSCAGIPWPGRRRRCHGRREARFVGCLAWAVLRPEEHGNARRAEPVLCLATGLGRRTGNASGRRWKRGQASFSDGATAFRALPVGAGLETSEGGANRGQLGSASSVETFQHVVVLELDRPLRPVAIARFPEISADAGDPSREHVQTLLERCAHRGYGHDTPL